MHDGYYANLLQMLMQQPMHYFWMNHHFQMVPYPNNVLRSLLTKLRDKPPQVLKEFPKVLKPILLLLVFDLLRIKKVQ